MITDNDRILLNHILDAIQAIEGFVSDVTIVDFVESDLIASAVIKKFEIIGEASNNLSEEVRREFTEITWKEVVGMRNVLIHDYMGVDLESVWNTIEEDLPVLKQALKKYKF